MGPSFYKSKLAINKIRGKIIVTNRGTPFNLFGSSLTKTHFLNKSGCYPLNWQLVNFLDLILKVGINDMIPTGH